MKKTKYQELQGFNRWDAIALLAILIVATSYTLGKYIFSGQLAAMDPLTLGFIILCLLGMTAAMIYLLSVKMEIVVKGKSIRFQYYPLQAKKHKIKLKDVKDFKVVKTPPAAAYSGWNVRYNTDEEFYSVCGRTGIQLKLKNGKKFFIGCKRPEKLREIMTKVLRSESKLPAR